MVEEGSFAGRYVVGLVEVGRRFGAQCAAGAVVAAGCRFGGQCAAGAVVAVECRFEDQCAADVAEALGLSFHLCILRSVGVG